MVKQTSADKKSFNPVSIAIAYFVIMTSIDTNLNVFMPKIAWYIVQLGFYFFVILSLRRIKKRFTIYHFGAGLVFLIVYFLSFFTSSLLSVHYSAMLFFVRWGIPLFLLGVSVDDFGDLLAKLRFASLISLLLTILGIFVLKTNSSVTQAYSQDTGYQTLIPFAVFGADFLLLKKKSAIILMIASFAIVIMSGARGPLLAFLICFALELFFGSKNKIRMLICFGAFAVIVLLLYSLFFDRAIELLIDAFEKRGLSLRILERLKAGTLGTDSGRKALSTFAFEYSKSHLFYGTGLINDRILLFENLTVDTNKTVFGYYCHNIFLEIMMQYGLILGVLMCLMFILLIFVQFRINKTPESRSITIILLSAGLLPLLVSYSYATYECFYLFFGFIFTQFFQSKRKAKHNNNAALSKIANFSYSKS